MDDASPLETRRAELRALHDRILEATKALPMPQSHAEADRAFRCVASADRALIQLYSKASVTTLRAYSPRAARTPTATPEPDDFVYIYDDGIDDEPASPLLQAEGKAKKKADIEIATAATTSHAAFPHNDLAAVASGPVREEKDDTREKAFTHLESLIEKAARLTADPETARLLREFDRHRDPAAIEPPP